MFQEHFLATLFPERPAVYFITQNHSDKEAKVASWSAATCIQWLPATSKRLVLSAMSLVSAAIWSSKLCLDLQPEQPG